MSSTRRVTIAAGTLLLFSFVGSVLLLCQVDHLRSNATIEQVLFISSPRALKRMSLGYDGLLADIYWTRAVQYFGTAHHSTGHYELLYPLLNIATVLDPHLVPAYEFGANFVGPKPPNGAGQPEKAIALTEFGIRNNLNEWRLYYNLGFIHYTEMKNYSAAADAFARGSKVPGAHPFLRILAAQMAQHAGESDTARMLWTTTYQASQDPSIRANAVAHLRALRVDDEVTKLESTISLYRQKTGRSPSNFAELARAGLIGGVPVDPLGRPYNLTADGKLEVRSPDDLPFIQKGMPAGYVPPKRPKLLPSD